MLDIKETRVASVVSTDKKQKQKAEDPELPPMSLI